MEGAREGGGIEGAREGADAREYDARGVSMRGPNHDDATS